MPLLVPGTRTSDAELTRMIREHRVGIEEIVEWASAPATTVGPPLSILTLSDLGRDLLALCDHALTPEAPRGLRLLVVDVSYDGMLALIDLKKSHSDLPKVPRSGKASP
jgi:hypothetical protein